MTFEAAIRLLQEDERFRATVYAMNTLLLQKGVYTADEFEHYFCQHAENSLNGFREAKKREETSPEVSVATP